ncbi:PfkB family carbohydrate kinase [Geodermatophilus chilensis]|jgi:ribokinase|uniref:PfkB family carbohydrate kinase n=1 Tax=Geodermatophilus chilensis TaxID=2035835 RepID=UPI000C25D0B0|nr:PfkB family carbohydrate kinase [Geodermatophilus chilensis]
MADVVVLGQVGRDLVLRTPALPEAGGSATVGERRELLGGKGANQAVALAQLGVPVALVGVVGDDHPGVEAVAQAAADGIDVSAVVRRRGASTALLVDLVEDGGVRRLLEDVPDVVLLTPDDVAAATDQIAAAQVVSLQLQQPGPAVVAALQRVPEGAVVVVDGAPEDDATRDAVLARADVVRADAIEARLLAGRELSGVDDARDAAAELLTAGARVVAMGVGEEGDMVAWRAGPRFGVAAGELEVDPGWADGDVVVPLLGGQPVDPTGGGDAYVAALTATLLGGAAPEDAAWVASAAAGLTVGHSGGRPELTPDRLREAVRLSRGR